jgi:hypothetical protein
VIPVIRGVPEPGGDNLARLEDELCSFIPGSREEDGRLDALVWAASELLVKPPPIVHESAHGLGPGRLSGGRPWR